MRELRYVGLERRGGEPLHPILFLCRAPSIERSGAMSDGPTPAGEWPPSLEAPPRVRPQLRVIQGGLA